MRLFVVVTILLCLMTGIFVLISVTAIVATLSDRGTHPAVWSAAGSLLGAILGSLGTLWITRSQERRRQDKEAGNLAQSIHAEVANLVARCCFDSEDPWKQYWSDSQPARLFNVVTLRKFAPAEPAIYPTVGGNLALLPGNAPLAIIQFHYSLAALRREITNIADAETNRMEPISRGALALVAARFGATLAPGLRALESLAQAVPNAAEVERNAIEQYDCSRRGARPTKTLRERIAALLPTTVS